MRRRMKNENDVGDDDDAYEMKKYSDDVGGCLYNDDDVFSSRKRTN
jgi:hypothetical protein